MKNCIYCTLLKPDEHFGSTEHLIPQFLGGDYAPDRFKTDAVCKKCNNNLGLFVDGSFAKSWFVTNWLTFAGMAAYGPTSKVGPPLMFMGISEFELPEMTDNEVCESWLGPAGERVHLVRPRDDRLFWYAGGNPIDAKRVETRGYFSFSEKTQMDPRRTLLAFRDSFKDWRVKKVCCADVNGFDMKSIGFSSPDEIDQRRIDYIRAKTIDQPVSKASIPLNVQFDYRFMSKLALGVAFAHFGEPFLQSSYAEEIRKGLWFRDGDAEPNILGASAFSRNPHINNELFRRFVGLENAVTIHVSQVPEGAALILNLGQSHAWTLLCATRDVIAPDFFQFPRLGLVLIIYPFLRECFEMTLVDYIGHKLGHRINSELASAEVRSVQGKPKLNKTD